MASWGEPILSASFSASPNVDFINLPFSPRELLFIAQGVKHAGADQNLFLRLSDDNGAAFETAGYTNIGNTPTSGMSLTGATALAADPVLWGCAVQLLDFNSPDRPCRSLVMQGREASTAGSPGILIGRFNTPRVNNAIRFTNSGGVNWTGGSFLLFARN